MKNEIITSKTEAERMNPYQSVSIHINQQYQRLKRVVLRLQPSFPSFLASPPMESQLDVTVHSLAGDILVETSTSSIPELADAAARKLNAKKCHLVADGKIIDDYDDFGDKVKASSQVTLTAVAQNVNPLLQLVGLQTLKGELVNETVSMLQLEQIALDVATSLAHTACWFGTSQHIGGSPTIVWKYGDLLDAPAPFSDGVLRIKLNTPVVHQGAMLVFSIADLPCFPALQRIPATRELTVDDIMKIRSAHQEQCQKNKSKLLEKHPGLDAVQAVMRLVRYTAEEVFFELGHRAYKLAEDL